VSNVGFIEDLGVGLPPPTNLPREAVIYGRVVKIEDTYQRELPVPRGLVVVTLAAAVVTRLASALLALLLRTSAAIGDMRGWRALCKGPEYCVTPVWIKDTDGLFVEVEVHGYLSARALQCRDRVRVLARRQPGPYLPMQAHRIENLTVGRRIVSRRPTVWTHFGPGLLIQAVIGLVVAGWLATSLAGTG
jgi:hypothetical protein